MHADDLVWLRHMRDAALEAIGFMRDKGPSDLEEDRMLQFAVIRAIEIVGEAAPLQSRHMSRIRRSTSIRPFRGVLQWGRLC
jgi:uncharacterized protein with HEPN domain